MALIMSVVWVGLTIGGGIVHTDVILKGQLTPEQDGALSEKYGKACGGGLVAVWVLAYLLRRKETVSQARAR